MKKALSLILILVLTLSLCACGSETNTQDAFADSQQAFKYVTTAYLATNRFAEDIYEAWYQGVNNRSDYDQDSELGDFADQMHVDLASIKQATANLLGKESYSYGDWALLPYLYNNSYFSAWISVIAEAYECSGEADKIRENLSSAKGLMKQLSDKYSDYEHYPSLKKFFTNTLAYFDFCSNPEGTFEQVKDTFNNYRNAAREYFFDLNYMFGDSIGGMDDYVNADKNTTEETAPETTSIT